MIKLRREKLAFEFAYSTLQDMEFSKEILLIICAMIYWCEGGKSERDAVYFTNSDPDLISLFLRLLRKSFNLDELQNHS